MPLGSAVFLRHSEVNVLSPSFFGSTLTLAGTGGRVLEVRGCFIL